MPNCPHIRCEVLDHCRYDRMDQIAALRAEANRLEAVNCTGIAAQWCPTHGTCTCPDRGDDMGRTLNDPNCPLHQDDSSHAEEVPA